MIALSGDDYDGHIGSIVFTDEERGLCALGCRTCGYVHLTPLPQQDELDALYDAVYADAVAPDGERRRCLYEQEAGQQWYWRLVFGERMREFERLLPRCFPLHYPVYILDFGAGCGRFTNYITVPRWSGWTAWGYEPDEAAIALAEDPFALYSKHPKEWGIRFEAAHCSLVLEHVLDPLMVLREIHDLLLPGGVACIVVPNEFNPLQVRLYEYGYSPLHLTHVNYFTLGSLEVLVKRAGFEVVRRSVTFPIEWFALHGLNYVRHWRAGRVAHLLRMVFEGVLLKWAPERRRALCDGWAARGIGREIELWVRKK